MNEAQRATEQATVHAVLHEIGMERKAADARLAAWLPRGLKVRVHEHIGAGGTLEYLETVLGMDRHTGQEWLRVGRALLHLPAIQGSMERGRVTWSAAREVTRIAVRETDEEWALAVAGRTAREVESMVSGRKPGDRPSDPKRNDVRRYPFKLLFEADQFAILSQGLDRVTKLLGRSVSAEEAITVLARSYVEGGDGTERKTRIQAFQCEGCEKVFLDAGARRVAVDPKALDLVPARTPPAADGDDGSHVGADAGLDPETSLLLDEITRHIPAPLRRAVIERHGCKCAVPSCRHRHFLHLHHVLPFADGGQHTMQNLILLCSEHHRAIHEGALRVEGDVVAGLRFVSSRNGQGPPTAWELVTSALYKQGFTKAEARSYAAAAEAVAPADITVNDALLLALRMVPVQGVREDPAPYDRSPTSQPKENPIPSKPVARDLQQNGSRQHIGPRGPRRITRRSGPMHRVPRFGREAACT